MPGMNRRLTPNGCAVVSRACNAAGSMVGGHLSDVATPHAFAKILVCLQVIAINAVGPNQRQADCP